MHAANAYTNHPANCTITLDKYGFKIVDPNHQVLCQGTKGEHDKLWFMPSNIQTPTVCFASANIFVKDEPNAVFVAYQSACFLNPPDSTFENAAQKGYLGNLPRLTAKMIRNNRPNSIGTAHGHLNRLRQNIRSTKIDPVKKKKDKKILNKQSIINTNTSIPISNIVKESTGEQEEEEMVTKTIQLSDLSPDERKALAAYFDATGRFPFQSEEGYEYMLVSVYKNYIHVEPMVDRRAPSYVAAYRSTINFFRSKGHILSVCRLDNESSVILENFFNEEVKMDFNFIAAGNHRANKAERAIQSWKNHFIAGIATIDPDFPMTQWPKFLLQAELTLNHLRPFADNDKISAYEGIYKSKYDFKAHPIAPIGTKVVVYEPSDQRTSWNPHGIQGFYLGPALNHYRSVAVYIPNTNGIRISDQCQYFPKPFKFPGASTNEILLNSIVDLKNVINNTTNVIENTKLNEAIDKLDNAIEIFNKDEIPPEPQSPDGTNEIDQMITSYLLPNSPNNTIEDIHEVIDNEPNYTSKRVLYDKHHLRSAKDKKSKNDKYRKLTPQESKTDYYKRLKERIGQHWIDKETKEEFVINTVVMPTKLKGKGSKTAYYSFFNISQNSLPTLKRYLQYTPCHEINTGKYVTWIQRGNSAFACSIRSNNPKDPNRGLNQTKEGQPLNFRKAMKLDPELWLKADEEEWHRLLENTLIPIKRNTIPPNESITYYNKQIKEKLVTIDNKDYIDARVRGTLGGDRSNYEGITSTHTAEYPFIKTLFSAVLHDVKYVDPNTRFVNIDMTDFYLKSPMEEPAYIAVPFKDIPESIINQYNLKQTATNDKAYFKVMMTMYGHPVSGYLSNKHLFKTIEPEGYYEDAKVPCMLKHKTRPTIGVIVVDDIGLKVRSKDDVTHLVNAIEKVWKVKIKWQGNRYVGMDLNWDYNPEDPTLEISCDQIIPDALKRFYPNEILKGADTPGIEIKGWTLGTNNKVTTVEEDIPVAMPEKTKFVQQFTGTLSHASRIVRHNLLPAVNDIASTQSAPNSKTMKQVDRLSNYIARFPKASVIFKATDMITKAMYDSALTCMITW